MWFIGHTAFRYPCVTYATLVTNAAVSLISSFDGKELISNKLFDDLIASL